MQSNSCILCSSRIESVLSLGEQAYVNTYVGLDYDGLITKHRLELCVCTNEECRHLQLSHLAPPKSLFSHYLWVTGTASASKAYAYKLRDSILGMHEAPQTVVEIASNDGTFLKPFIEVGLTVIGVEPASNIAVEANERGVTTLCEFFTDITAETCITRLGGNPDVILARNVVPHTPNPRELVGAISRLAGNETSVFIEVHCFEAIEEQLQYDSIYHEHYSYFSAFTLTNLFREYDLAPIAIKRTEISGGSLLIQFKKNHLAKYKNIERAIDSSKLLHSKGRLEVFAEKCVSHSECLKKVFAEAKEAYPSLPFYSFGSSARGNTILTHSGIASEIEACIDNSALKHGKINANTQLRIVSLTDITDRSLVLYLAAWNFKDEILSQIKNHGIIPRAIIVPFPKEPKVIHLSAS